MFYKYLDVDPRELVLSSSLSSYIIRSDPLAGPDVPEDAGQSSGGGQTRQDFGTETRDETHL